MKDDIVSLPPIAVSFSPELAEKIQMAAARAALNVEKGGNVLMESAEHAPILNFDLSPRLPYLEGFAVGAAAKVIDGAFGEIGAEALRRLGKMILDVREHAIAKPATTISVRVSPRIRRTYNIPAIDVEAAVENILRDAGLIAEGEHPLDRSRFWNEGAWIGGEQYRVREISRQASDYNDALIPKPETFAAFEELGQLLVADITYVSRGADIGIEIPESAHAETIEAAVKAIRAALPGTVIGLDASRRRICVNDALS